MKRMLLAAVCVAVTSTSGAAAKPLTEEPPIGSRLGTRVERDMVGSEKEAALTAHQFASCLVSRRDKDVHDFLSAEEQASKKAARRLHGEVRCLSMDRPRTHLVEGFAVTFPHDVLRGMLSEHWLKKSAPEAGLLQPLPLQPVYQRHWFATTNRASVVDEMGACLSDVNPAGVMSLIRTEPYSDFEEQAFAALGPFMSSCLRAGAKLQANRQALRAAVAEALYHRVRAPASPPSAASNSSE